MCSGLSRVKEAALLSREHRLPLADSVILEPTGVHQARLWKQDEHFKGLPGLAYMAKK